mmetsp:Transcript_40422/g.87286  ORF Transcript_40422/g.87286 Transcript_40422/m.87286 type:complete len:91 (-) Transcript_40422:1543-1815(-)
MCICSLYSILSGLSRFPHSYPPQPKEDIPPPANSPVLPHNLLPFHPMYSQCNTNPHPYTYQSHLAHPSTSTASSTSRHSDYNIESTGTIP